MAQKLNTRIVVIEKVTKNSVMHNEGLSAEISNFPGAKVGQRWLLTTDDAPPWILGKIVKAVLLDEQAA